VLCGGGKVGYAARPGLAGWVINNLSPCKAGPCGGVWGGVLTVDKKMFLGILSFRSYISLMSLSQKCE